MNLYAHKDTAMTEMFPGAKARFVHTDKMTLAEWEFSPGIDLPEHAHPHEQITKVISGEFELTVDGQSVILNAGDCVHIPSNAVHSGRSNTACRIIDSFHPAREDFKAYGS